MANIRDLPAYTRKIGQQVPTLAHERAKRIALAIIIELAYATPVDTSKAISNWQVQLDTAPQGPLEPYFPGKGGTTRNASAQETIDVARQVLRSKRPGQDIYISNLVPYILALNAGHSGQAPIGFIERAVLLGRLAGEGSTANV